MHYSLKTHLTLILNFMFKKENLNTPAFYPSFTLAVTCVFEMVRVLGA